MSSIYHKKDCCTDLCGVVRKLLKIRECGYNTTGCEVLRCCYGGFKKRETVLEGHTDIICSIIELKNGQLASYSYDKTIKICDLNGKCLATLKGHTDAVRSIIELKNGQLASCSDDKTIKIWDC